jgi:predicted acyltransferase
MSITEATPYPLPPPQSQPPRPAMIGLPDIEIAAPLPPPKPARLVSLDIFRGITIAGMLLVNNPGSWSSKYAPLGHAEWHGWTPTDLVFPFFLFIVGVAIPFSMAKRSTERNASRFGVFAGIWGRALALVMLGLLLQGLPSANFDALGPERSTLAFMRVAAIWTIGVSFVLLLFPWPSRKLNIVFPILVAAAFATLAVGIFHANKEALESGLPASFNFGSGVLTPWKMRFPGVLQRIGVCYGVAATLALFAPGWRTLLGFAVFFCTVYSVFMLRAPYHDHEIGSITKEDNLARRIDEDVFRDHNYGSYPDPEGLLSTLPAIAEVLLGILVGLGLRQTDPTPSEKAARVLSWGVFCSVAGVFLGWWLMPINKQIWTPSFTLFTAGMGMLGLGAIYFAADVKGYRAWGWPFKVYGMNAIAAFVFSGILVRILSIVKVTDGHSATKMSVIEFVKLNVASSMHAIEAFCQQHIPKLAQVDTPNNISLAYAVLFVCAIWVIMFVMYVCRIFLKV